jgi:hypothetical protein
VVVAAVAGTPPISINDTPQAHTLFRTLRFRMTICYTNRSQHVTIIRLSSNLQHWSITCALLKCTVPCAPAHHAHVMEGAVRLLASLACDVVESKAATSRIGVKRGDPVGKVHRLGCEG